MWWDILAPLKSPRQKSILLILAIFSVGLWYFMDRAYQVNSFGWNDVVYLTTETTTYSIGELLHESSGVLETFFTWWVIAKYAAAEQESLWLKYTAKAIKFTALFKMTTAFVSGCFFLFVNPFVINLARTTYAYWELGAFLLNCFLFIGLPALIRKRFIVKK